MGQTYVDGGLGNNSQREYASAPQTLSETMLVGDKELSAQAPCRRTGIPENDSVATITWLKHASRQVCWGHQARWVAAERPGTGRGGYYSSDRIIPCHFPRSGMETHRGPFVSGLTGGRTERYVRVHAPSDVPPNPTLRLPEV